MIATGMKDAHSLKGRSWLSAAGVLVALVLFGMMTGGLIATRVFTTSGMGWDRLADTLGGLMVGGGVGLFAGLVAVRMLSVRGRRAATGAALIGCVAALLYLQATPPNVRRRAVVDVPALPVDSFSFQLGAADGLGGPPTDGTRLPWERLRIASNLSLDYVPMGRSNEDRQANDALNTAEGIAALAELRALLAGLPREMACGDPCPTCMDVSLEWFLNGERGIALITDRCWHSLEPLQPVRASVERLFATYGPRAVCERPPP